LSGRACCRQCFSPANQDAFSCVLENRNFIIYLGPLGESVILANEPVSFTNNLTEWLARTGIGNWSICWRATRDGWAASKFHSNCDGIKPTLTIVQVAATFVFGGYATESWNATSKYSVNSRIISFFVFLLIV
jgi:hypothetical protein